MEIKKQFLRVMSIALMLSVIVPAYGLTWLELRRKCRAGKCSNAEWAQFYKKRSEIRTGAKILGGMVAIGAGLAAVGASQAALSTSEQRYVIKRGLGKLYRTEQMKEITDKDINATFDNLIRLYKREKNQQQEPSPWYLTEWLDSQRSITYVIGGQEVNVEIPRGKIFKSYYLVSQRY